MGLSPFEPKTKAQSLTMCAGNLELFGVDVTRLDFHFFLLVCRVYLSRKKEYIILNVVATAVKFILLEECKSMRVYMDPQNDKIYDCRKML